MSTFAQASKQKTNNLFNIGPTFEDLLKNHIQTFNEKNAVWEFELPE